MGSTIFILWLLTILAVAVIAHYKGRNAYIWAGFAAISWLFALIVVYLVPEVPKKTA